MNGVNNERNKRIMVFWKNDNKICFNFFEANVSSFKKISGKVQKIATHEIINSGKFPLFINDNLE